MHCKGGDWLGLGLDVDHLVLARSRVLGARLRVGGGGQRGGGWIGGGSGAEEAGAGEEDGLQLAVATAPGGEDDGESGGGHHGEPPHRVAGEGAGVERGEDEVEKMDGEGKVGDELATGDEDDNGDGPGGGGRVRTGADDGMLGRGDE